MYAIDNKLTTEYNYKYIANDSFCDKTAVAKGTYNIKNWNAVPYNDVAVLSVSVPK